MLNYAKGLVHRQHIKAHSSGRLRDFSHSQYAEFFGTCFHQAELFHETRKSEHIQEIAHQTNLYWNYTLEFKQNSNSISELQNRLDSTILEELTFILFSPFFTKLKRHDPGWKWEPARVTYDFGIENGKLKWDTKDADCSLWKIVDFGRKKFRIPRIVIDAKGSLEANQVKSFLCCAMESKLHGHDTRWYLATHTLSYAKNRPNPISKRHGLDGWYCLRGVKSPAVVKDNGIQKRRHYQYPILAKELEIMAHQVGEEFDNLL